MNMKNIPEDKKTELLKALQAVVGKIEEIEEEAKATQDTPAQICISWLLVLPFPRQPSFGWSWSVLPVAAALLSAWFVYGHAFTLSFMPGSRPFSVGFR